MDSGVKFLFSHSAPQNLETRPKPGPFARPVPLVERSTQSASGQAVPVIFAPILVFTNNLTGTHKQQ